MVLLWTHYGPLWTPYYWTLYGSPMDPLFNGHPIAMDHLWTPYGPLWTSYNGPSIAAMDHLWTPVGPPMENVCNVLLILLSNVYSYYSHYLQSLQHELLLLVKCSLLL